MAIFTEPKKWGVIPGSAADVGEIQEKGSTLYPSIADLWPAIYQLALSKGGKAPERTGFNAFFKMSMERLYFIERGGVWSYDATADYPRRGGSGLFRRTLPRAQGQRLRH